jgi:hypothetical protein
MPVFYFENRRYPAWTRFCDLGRELSFGHPRGVAYERDGYFFATGLNHGGEAIATHTNDLPIVDWITQTFLDPSPAESPSEPGIRFRRIWRPPSAGVIRNDPGLNEKLDESFVALRILLKKLEELFETIEPTPSNLQTYGLKIRDVLLLACMEVESSWTAVLTENGYTSPSGRFTTNDYVRLYPPMTLDGYELSLQSYASYPSFTPFAGWDVAQPTRSLGWYDAYNRTKHNRESHLSDATLGNAVSAVGAAVVMFHAQFGLNFGTGFADQKNPIIRNTFRLNTVGFERHERDFYIPLFRIENNQVQMEEWQTVNCPF